VWGKHWVVISTESSHFSCEHNVGFRVSTTQWRRNMPPSHSSKPCNPHCCHSLRSPAVWHCSLG